MIKILKHITDVGSPFGDGTDSNIRIEKQYERLGIVPRVISAGHSPLHVSFTASTVLSTKASQNVDAILKKLNLEATKKQPVALNSAPRNSSETKSDGEEDYIYKVTFSNKDIFLIYGFDVLRWVLEFHNNTDVQISKIISVTDIIENTSKGSQFRSGEHLPIVHFLESENALAEHSTLENIDQDSITSIFKDKINKVVVAPSDEYGNGRLIIHEDLLEKVLNSKTIQIPTLTSNNLPVKNSLTEITPDELSIWISSNHFPNKKLKVLNIGTRWKEKTTKTTNTEIIELVKRLSQKTGTEHEIIFQ